MDELKPKEVAKPVKPVEGLKIEEFAALRKEHLRQQEAVAEQARLSYLAAKAAVDAIRQEMSEGT